MLGMKIILREMVKKKKWEEEKNFELDKIYSRRIGFRKTRVTSWYSSRPGVLESLGRICSS